MPDKDELNLIQSSCFYIRKIKGYDPIEVNNDKYYYFELLDENKNVIDVYDFIKIIAHVQIDFENNLFRIYPALTPKYHYECVFYNRYNHTITTPEDEVEVTNGWDRLLGEGDKVCE